MIAVATPSVATTISGARMFGRMWRVMIAMSPSAHHAGRFDEQQVARRERGRPDQPDVQGDHRDARPRSSRSSGSAPSTDTI